MLHLFRNNSPYTVLILFIFTFVAKLQALSYPALPIALPDHFVFGAIVHFFSRYLGFGAFGYTLFTVLLLFGQALYLTAITHKHRLFVRPSYFPAFAYILLSSINPSLNYFSEPLLINWFVLFAFDTILRFNQTAHPRKQIFNAGFLLCLAGIIQVPALGFALLLLIALLLLRSFNPGEWVVALMGYFTPVYFFAAILFLVDRFSLLATLPGFELPRFGRITTPVYVVGSLTGLFILFVAGIYAMQVQLPKATIYIRRSWLTITMYLLVACAVALFAMSWASAEWLIAMPALSLIIAQALSLEKTKRFSNFTFYFSLLFLIFCQLALNR